MLLASEKSWGGGVNNAAMPDTHKAAKSMFRDLCTQSLKRTSFDFTTQILMSMERFAVAECGCLQARRHQVRRDTPQPKFKVSQKEMNSLEKDLRGAIREDAKHLKARRAWLEADLKNLTAFSKTDKCAPGDDGKKVRVTRNLAVPDVLAISPIGGWKSFSPVVMKFAQFCFFCGELLFCVSASVFCCRAGEGQNFQWKQNANEAIRNEQLSPGYPQFASAVLHACSQSQSGKGQVEVLAASQNVWLVVSLRNSLAAVHQQARVRVNAVFFRRCKRRRRSADIPEVELPERLYSRFRREIMYQFDKKEQIQRWEPPRF